MRRILFAVIALFLGLTGAAHAADNPNDPSDPVKVVYHLMEGNDQAMRAMNNIRNHLQADPKAKIVVVTHGQGIDFLLEGAKDRNGQGFESRIAGLANQGVEFRVCRNTLEQRKIDESKVVQEAKIVPSGVAEVARLQAKEHSVVIKQERRARRAVPSKPGERV
jgi:intracellular sulfur oxidation DsrE/DsrF family protein